MTRIVKGVSELLALLAFAGWAGIANASVLPVLLIVDISDPSAVTISGTGAPSEINDSSSNTFDGVSLISFFTADLPAPALTFIGPPGSLTPSGTKGSYNFGSVRPTLGDLNLWCSPPICQNQPQGFLTSSAAFSGVATLNFSAVSLLLPTAGSWGSIIAGDGTGGSGQVIGEWKVIPIPAAFWLYGTALIGLTAFTRRHQVFS